MTSSKHTKRALLASVLSVVLCCAMLIGSTFAWFTDSVTSTGNIIKSGTLEVTMEWAKGTENPASATWKDASEGAIFDYDLWEPGYTEVRHVRISNVGSLALKYEVRIAATGEVSELADVIDVYYIKDGEQITDRTQLKDSNKIGTLAQVLANPYAAKGNLLGKKGETVDSDIATIALKMQESAGNEYQGKSIGSEFAIQLVATQDTVEYDSFGNEYDANAETDEFKQGVTISGIAGVAESYDTIQDAYEAVKAMLVANSGLVEQTLSEEAFNAFFTDGGKITWTIYGNQKVTDNRMFSFGRAANRFGEGRHITEINIVGGNSSAALDLTAVNGTFALPYNWWNVEDSVNTALKCKNITFNGIKYMPSATYQCTLYPTTYEFDGCTFNGNLYSYQNFDVNMTIKNCTFNAPADTQYAFMSQGQGGTITLDNNAFNNYTRGINLERATADFVITNNTIRSTVSESDRGAIQLTDGKSFVVTGNTVDVNAGNAFWFHNAATNVDVTYTISNNDIKAPYIGYYGTSFDVNDKITSSGNKFNSTDTTKCMKKGATVAEATNLTAIH